MDHFKDEVASESVRQHLLSHRDAIIAESAEERDRPLIILQERKSRWLTFATHFTAFSLGVFVAAMIFGLVYKSTLSAKEQTYTFARTDAIPSVPSEIITFEADPIYSEKSSDETDFAWNMLLPPGRGYVFVDDSHQRGLAPGQMTFEGEIYSVSMYHQLHCLARLRQMHWIFQDAVITGEQAIAMAHAGREPSAHIRHCFDYLRQAIQCNGDMTLEWPRQDGPSSGVAVDGWGVPHTCKSPSAIKSYMDKFHFNGSMSFDAAG